MKKAAIILLAIMLFILAGCTNKEVINHNYTFKGENELWTTEYKVNGTGIFTKIDGKLHYESYCDNILTISYKKDLSDLSVVKHLEISYESNTGGGKLTEDFDDGPPYEKTYTFKSGGKNVAIPDKDETIKVTINIDGKTQVLELKSE